MDGFPKCQVCHQHFTLQGPAPYLLPCLHAVCETCLTSTAGGVMSCSTCHREVNLTETHLQKDVVRQREIFNLTVQHRPSELQCTHEDDGNQAVCWCPECEELLCEYCHYMHDSFKATRKHAVQEIRDIQPGSQDHEEYCSIHTKYPLDTWDRSCKVLICGKCRLDDHAQHDLEEVSAAADAARSRIEAQQKNVLQVIDKDNSLLETTRVQLKCTTETSKTLRDNISHTFQSLRSVLDQREKVLHIFLQQHTDQAVSHLDARTKVTQSHQLRCQITSEYIQKALLYSTKCELLKVKKAIEEKTQTCLDSTIEQGGVPVPEFFTGDFDKLWTQLSSFGNRHAHKDTSSQGRGIEVRGPDETRPVHSESIPDPKCITDREGHSLEPGDAVWFERNGNTKLGIYVGGQEVVWSEKSGRHLLVYKGQLQLTDRFRKFRVHNDRGVPVFPPEERVDRAMSRVGTPFTEGDRRDGLDFIEWIYTGMGVNQAWNRGFILD